MRISSVTPLVPRLLLLLAPVSVFGQQVPLVNWTVPPYRGSAPVQGGLTTMTDVTSGVGFVGIQPCRVADTRGNGAPIQGGIFPNGAQRTWDLTGLCGIPAGTDAISANFSVVSPAATPLGAFLLAWPTGQAAPPTAVMTYGPGATVISNAAVVPLGPGEQLNVNVSHSTHVILDVNGYFTDQYNAGRQFVAATSIDAGGAILGANFSAVTGSHGVGGFAGGAGIVHGVQGEVGPGALGDSSGVHGISNSNLPVFGVLGEANGTNGIGVGGVASVTAAGATYGVYGETRSSSNNAGAVYGFAIESAANAGIFVNTGAAGAFLGTRVSGINYGLYTDNRIRGGGLDIVGLPKNFVAPHPEDPGLEIRYASVEAPTVDVCFRGTASLVNGSASIEVPDHFRYTAREGTYMTTLTPVGRPVVLSVEQEGPDGIVVRGSGSARFHYVVWAERAEIVDYAPIVKNTTFTPEALEKGGGPQTLPESTRAILVRNGTLHADGTYNVETARARGWTIPERPDEPARRPH